MKKVERHLVQIWVSLQNFKRLKRHNKLSMKKIQTKCSKKSQMKSMLRMTMKMLPRIRRQEALKRNLQKRSLPKVQASLKAVKNQINSNQTKTTKTIKKRKTTWTRNILQDLSTTWSKLTKKSKPKATCKTSLNAQETTKR